MGKKYPKRSNNELLELRKRIRPVLRFARGPDGLFESVNGFPYYILPHPDIHMAPYFGEAVATEEMVGVKPLTQIKTYHSTGGFFFKPSEAEVLSQIPSEFIGNVVAYEIIDCNMDRARSHGDSTATVQLYSNI